MNNKGYFYIRTTQNFKASSKLNTPEECRRLITILENEEARLQSEKQRKATRKRSQEVEE